MYCVYYYYTCKFVHEPMSGAARLKSQGMGNWYLLLPHNQRKIYWEPTKTHDWWKVILTMAARQHVSRFAIGGRVYMQCFSDRMSDSM